MYENADYGFHVCESSSGCGLGVAVFFLFLDLQFMGAFGY